MDAMGLTVKITEEIAKAVNKDATEQTEFLSTEETNRIATKINRLINIPFFLSEEEEQVIFFKLVKKIDRFIYQQIPNELLALMRLPSRGINEQMAGHLKKRLAKHLNDEINIPFLSESAEQEIFEMVLEILISSMLEGRSLEIATK